MTGGFSLPLRIALLGPPRVDANGEPVVVDTRKAIALLAYVAVVGRPVARETLADLLWPESDPEDARGALRRTLSVLRAGLGGRWLRVDRRDVVLDDEDVDVDVRAFRAAVADAAHGHDPGEACHACRRHLARASAYAQGPFLEGFALRDSAAFDEWQGLEGQAIEAELASCLRRLVALESAEGRSTQSMAAARRLLALDPLDEVAHRALMTLHAAAGDRAAVARQYRECVRILEADLGVEPSPETSELHRSLMAEPQASSRPAAVAAAVDPPLDRLATEVLAASAILGDDVDPDLALEVAGVTDAGSAGAFDTLVAAGILVDPDPEQHERGYRFADPSTRAATVARLGLARRRTLHRRAAQALRSRMPAGAAGPAVARTVAVHLAAGGRPAEAAEMHRLAGDAARTLSAHEMAAAEYRAALALGHPDPAALHEAIGDVETLHGRYGEALAAYEQGAALASRDGVPRFESRLGGLHLRRGALDLADLHLAAALARLPDGRSVLRGRVLADASLVAVRRGDAVAAARLARSSLREARLADDAEGEAQAENLLAMLARRAGDVDRARRHLRRSLDRAGQLDDPGARVAALNNLALLERAVGHLDDALSLTDEALRGCALVGDRHREAALRNNRADLLHALGRRREAVEELTRSVTAFAAVGEASTLDPAIWKLVDW